LIQAWQQWNGVFAVKKALQFQTLAKARAITCRKPPISSMTNHQAAIFTIFLPHSCLGSVLIYRVPASLSDGTKPLSKDRNQQSE